MNDGAKFHDIALIRSFILDAFTAEELRRFCQDRPPFRPILANLGPGYNLNRMVDEVITYCQAHHLFDELLSEVKRVNPRQYARFEPRLQVSADELAKIPCPYRGLEPFEAEHAEFYFGREVMVEQLVAKVKERPFVAVVGPSGCGKSSLVRAGLVTTLQQGVLPGSEDWEVRLFRPGSDPLWMLCRQLLALLEPEETRATQQLDAVKQAGALRDGTLSMKHVAADLRDTRPDVSHLLLIVDQFEELYVECQDEALRQAFVQALLAAAKEDNISVLLTLRADFYGHVLSDRALGPAVSVGLVNVLAMDEDELRAAIEQPALKTDRAFEPGLVERILEDIAGEPGDLPLLEFALTELWARQTARGMLTHEAYAAIGKVEGAIARRAEAVYADMEKAGHGETVRHVFLRLTRYGEGVEATRRRAALDDLVTPRTSQEDVEAVIKALADARLLVTGGEELPLTLPGAMATAEVSHEALIAGWARLRSWLDEDQAFCLWRDKLAAALRIWQEAEQDEGALLRGAPLSEAEGWLAERGSDLNQAERAFISDSQALRECVEEERREQQRKKAQLAAERRTAGRLRRLAVGLGVAVAVAAVLAVLVTVLLRVAVVQRDARATEVVVRSTAEADAILERDARATEVGVRSTAEALAILESDARATEVFIRTAAEEKAILQQNVAEQARATAIHAQATAESDSFARATAQAEAEAASEEASSLKLAFASQSQLKVNHELALLLAIEAGRIGHTLESDSALWSSLANQSHTLSILAGHSSYVWNAAWSPDGMRIVTSSNDGTARVWDAETGLELVVLTGHTGGVWHAAWSPDGKRIATASYLTVWVWDAESGTELAVLAGHESSVDHVTWDKDGRRIVTSSRDRTARVWDAERGVELFSLAGHTSWVNHAAWSPDDRLIVTASKDGTARLWDAGSGTEVAVLEGHTSEVNHAAWSSDGQYIVTASDDGTARVWDVSTALNHGAGGEGQSVLEGHEGPVQHAAWSSDGQRIVTSSLDTTARVWDAERGAQVAVFAGHAAGVIHAAWSPDGQRIVTASVDRTARVWDVNNGALVASLSGHSSRVWHAAWSPDGRYIVTTSYDATARVWQVASRPAEDGEVGAELTVLTIGSGAVRSAEWSSDGRYLVTAGDDDKARVWDAETRRQIAVWAVYSNGVLHAAWSPDSKYLVTAGGDGTARVWSVSMALNAGGEGAELAVLAGHSGWVWDASWSPDGRHIVTAADDGTARLWDVATALRTGGEGAELALLTGNTDTQWHAEWSPNGLYIVTASEDGTARVWDAEAALNTGGEGAELAVLTGHSSWVWDAAWSPDSQHIVTAGGDRTARIWDVSTALNTGGEGAELAIFTGHTGGLRNAAWSPDGLRIVTAGSDSTARVWDVATALRTSSEGAELAALTGHSSWVWDAAWSPDGKHIVTASDDGTTRIYYAQIEDLLDAACRRAVRNLSEEEWQRYMGNEPYRETCPGKPVPGRDF